MEKITNKTKVICLILAVVIITGIIVIATVGFNVELNLKANNRVELHLGKNFEITEIYYESVRNYLFK